MAASGERDDDKGGGHETHGRIVEASTGNVDPDGDVVGSLIERLRAQVGPDVSDAIDPDQQARLTAGLLLTAPLRQVK